LSDVLCEIYEKSGEKERCAAETPGKTAVGVGIADDDLRAATSVVAWSASQGQQERRADYPVSTALDVPSTRAPRTTLTAAAAERDHRLGHFSRAAPGHFCQAAKGTAILGQNARLS
jgi:hypothetical protein